ncbi:MAG: type III-A CRISPR-associated RAMP protein Csm5 [Chloroflexota bacterium]
MSELFNASRLKQVYRLEAEVIAPTQVGSGTKLLPEIDYFEDRNGTNVVDIEQLLSDPILAEQLASTTGGFRLDELAQQHKLDKYISYTLATRANKREIVAHVRDGSGRIYLPGSSIKGALRTVLAWNLYQKSATDPKVKAALNPNSSDLTDPRRNLKRLSERADDELEASFFAPAHPQKGKRPNFDLMKLIQVDDLYPESGNSRLLRLEDAQIFVRGRDNTLHSKNRPIAAEMLREKSRFSGYLRFDNFWQTSPQAEKLHFSNVKVDYLDKLVELGKARAAALIETELDFYYGCTEEQNSDQMCKWYIDLRSDLKKLGKDEFFMPLGWSTGWNGKTYAENLRLRGDFSLASGGKQGIRQAYRLGHWEDAASPFPISRKLVIDYNRNREPYAFAPLGWLLVKLTLRKN